MNALRRGACSDGTTTEHSQSSNGYLQAPLGRAARRRGAATWLAGCSGLGRPLPAVRAALSPWSCTSPGPRPTRSTPGCARRSDEFGATRAQCTVQFTVVSPWNAEKLTAGVAGGAAPPLTLLAPTSITTWGPQGLVEPLDDVFQRDKLSGNDFFPPVWETMSYQGQVWHLPLQVDPNFPFFWNKATLRQAGLNPDRAPATVDELDQAARPSTARRGASGSASASSPGAGTAPGTRWSPPPTPSGAASTTGTGTAPPSTTPRW